LLSLLIPSTPSDRAHNDFIGHIYITIFFRIVLQASAMWRNPTLLRNSLCIAEDKTSEIRPLYCASVSSILGIRATSVYRSFLSLFFAAPLTIISSKHAFTSFPPLVTFIDTGQFSLVALSATETFTVANSVLVSVEWIGSVHLATSGEEKMKGGRGRSFRIKIDRAGAAI